jgi:hypothetical protein
MDKPGVPLRSIEGFTNQQAEKLGRYNISTADEFVAVTNTEPNRTRIGTLLGADAEELQRLVALALAEVPEHLRDEMQRPAETSTYGLGALGPDPAKQKDPRERRPKV